MPSGTSSCAFFRHRCCWRLHTVRWCCFQPRSQRVEILRLKFNLKWVNFFLSYFDKLTITARFISIRCDAVAIAAFHCFREIFSSQQVLGLGSRNRERRSIRSWYNGRGRWNRVKKIAEVGADGFRVLLSNMMDSAGRTQARQRRWKKLSYVCLLCCSHFHFVRSWRGCGSSAMGSRSTVVTCALTRFGAVSEKNRSNLMGNSSRWKKMSTNLSRSLSLERSLRLDFSLLRRRSLERLWRSLLRLLDLNACDVIINN